MAMLRVVEGTIAMTRTATKPSKAKRPMEATPWSELAVKPDQPKKRPAGNTGQKASGSSKKPPGNI